MIDHSLLGAAATPEQIDKLCSEARQWKFATVCVNPCYVAQAAKLLTGCDVKVATTVGFPLGSATSSIKAAETADAIANGAQEVDMVINVGAIICGDLARAQADIAAVVAASASRATVKVIIEACYLSDSQKVDACRIAKQAGADFVKTSTGFGPSGATVADVKLMRETVGADMGVKAAGGIRDAATAQAMIAAGATRIGTSNSLAIISS